MKGSKWFILIVILIVVAVVIAKQARELSESPEPAVVAQVPTESEAAPPPPGSEEPEQAVPASATGTEQKPALKPQVQPSRGKPVTGDQAREEQPTTPAEPKTPGKPALNPGPQPSAEQPAEERPALGPKPEGPLPGSKLKECLKNGLPTMADFGLGTCKPCKAMEPILKQAAQDYWGRANILFVELDKYRELAREYRIRVMPTQIFFDASGNQVDSHMGYMDREEIDRRLAALGVKQ